MVNCHLEDVTPSMLIFTFFSMNILQDASIALDSFKVDSQGLFCNFMFLFIAPSNIVGTCKIYSCYFAGVRGNNDAFDMHQHAGRED